MLELIKAIKESNKVLQENADDLSRFLPEANGLYEYTVERIKLNTDLLSSMGIDI